MRSYDRTVFPETKSLSGSVLGSNNMFCPQCSNHNLDEAKFCRVCGTNLELVSLALTNRVPQALISPNSKPPHKRPDGSRAVVQGSILLGSSLLILLAGVLFSRGHFPWLVFWTFFFGWMACWGTVSLAIGVGRMIEAKVTPSLKGPQTGPEENSSVGFLPTISVTDHTTRQLGQRKS
jgi:hypothetical protein